LDGGPKSKPQTPAARAVGRRPLKMRVVATVMARTRMQLSCQAEHIPEHIQMPESIYICTMTSKAVLYQADAPPAVTMLP